IARPGLDKCQFPAGGIDHHNAGAGKTAASEINIPLSIDGHPVAAVFLTKIDECSSWSADQSLVIQWKCIDLHRTALWFGIGRPKPVPTVVVIADVQNLLVRTKNNAIGLLNSVRDFDHGAIAIPSVHRFTVQFSRLG